MSWQDPQGQYQQPTYSSGYDPSYQPTYDPYGQQQYSSSYGQQYTYQPAAPPPAPAPVYAPPPKKGFPVWIVVVVIFVVFIIIIAAVAVTLSVPADEDNKKVRFYAVNVHYNEILGMLFDINVTGYVENIDDADINFYQIRFECDAEFLTSFFTASLSDVAVNPQDSVLSPGERQEFDAYLGETEWETYTTVDEFELQFEGVRNDWETVDVSKYYR